ncbi:MAG: hypothetical protein QY303_11265 [Vicingaceae bacterium]|nr:MAG: hypothetical protein QY303_11265 [Vicingaceae bacterium]
MQKIIKHILLLYFLHFLGLVATAQDSLPVLPKPSRHSINLELGGGSVFYSLGYEYNFLKKKRAAWSGRIGFEYFPFGYSFGLPINANCIVGNKKIKFFSSVGILAILQRPEPWDRELRKKIKKGDLSSSGDFGGTYAGIQYIPAIQLPPTIGVGLQKDIKNMYVRLTANGFLLYGYNTVEFKYFYKFFPWGGVTIGLKLRTKLK